MACASECDLQCRSWRSNGPDQRPTALMATWRPNFQVVAAVVDRRVYGTSTWASGKQMKRAKRTKRTKRAKRAKWAKAAQRSAAEVGTHPTCPAVGRRRSRRSLGSRGRAHGIITPKRCSYVLGGMYGRSGGVERHATATVPCGTDGVVRRDAREVGNEGKEKEERGKGIGGGDVRKGRDRVEAIRKQSFGKAREALGEAGDRRGGAVTIIFGRTKEASNPPAASGVQHTSGRRP